MNSVGGVKRNYDYDPYGIQKSSSAADNNPYRYCGEYYDVESGYSYLRARYYDPNIGRFISEDPALDGLNWYTYCNNNPINYIDPSGQVPVETVIDVISIFASAGDLIKHPSLKNTGFLLWDVAATIVPYVPGSYTVKGAKVLVKGKYVSKVKKEKQVITKGIKAFINITGAKLTQIGTLLKSAGKSNRQSADKTKQGDRTAQDIISKDKKGSINKKFPKEWLNKTKKEIEDAARKGNKSAQTAKKLLNDKAFDKTSNSTRSKKQ